MARLVDASHGVEDGMVTSWGLSAAVACDVLSREDWLPHGAPGIEVATDRVERVGTTGTTGTTGTDVDTPFHRVADSADLARFVHTARRGLDAPPSAGLRVFAVPVNERGGGTFPVRAFALLGQPEGRDASR
ncbi:MAG: hypothetical protein AVDCRST_MAG49-4080 [uncultured Thermomicrobiales bacterium]|uniref:Uncharacterized protein n=1 Tax=uncultured Thermomicrobiales bacterium TaxID=1645740 RepID=A0A6J4VCB2_9BACT|nr:MAG: hypothetical protein AVDCRST_MAG49-4080 [uncultured Thermomicrobiales bacterium]